MPVVLTPISPTWPYGDVSSIQTEVGKINAATYADPDETQDPSVIAGHYQNAGDYAQSEIDSRLSGQGFAVPTVATMSIKQVWQELAAYSLYDIRGIDGSGAKDAKLTNVFAEKRATAIATINRLIKQSLFNPGAVGSFATATGQPTAVPQGVDASGSTTRCVGWQGVGYPWRWGW